jgi:CheY-like chemotaxis protein
LEKSDFKILVAEDDAMVREVIVKFLTEEKYPVVVANDGIEAIKLLRLEDVKLVLTDLRMPGADGMEVLRAAVTAYGTLDTALEAMREGAYDYIVKPFVMQQLLLVVRNAFRMANLVEENHQLSYYLKEMYRNLEAIKMKGSKKGNSGENGVNKKKEKSKKPDVPVIAKKRTVDDKNISQPENDNLKKYSTLINELKNAELLYDDDIEA